MRVQRKRSSTHAALKRYRLAVRIIGSEADAEEGVLNSRGVSQEMLKAGATATLVGYPNRETPGCDAGRARERAEEPRHGRKPEVRTSET